MYAAYCQTILQTGNFSFIISATSRSYIYLCYTYCFWCTDILRGSHILRSHIKYDIRDTRTYYKHAYSQQEPYNSSLPLSTAEAKGNLIDFLFISFVQKRFGRHQGCRICVGVEPSHAWALYHCREKDKTHFINEL